MTLYLGTNVVENAHGCKEPDLISNKCWNIKHIVYNRFTDTFTFRPMYRDVDKGMVYLVFYFRIHVTNNKSVLVNQRDYFIIGLFSEFENK